MNEKIRVGFLINVLAQQESLINSVLITEILEENYTVNKILLDENEA